MSPKTNQEQYLRPVRYQPPTVESVCSDNNNPAAPPATAPSPTRPRAQHNKKRGVSQEELERLRKATAARKAESQAQARASDSRSSPTRSASESVFSRRGSDSDTAVDSLCGSATEFNQRQRQRSRNNNNRGNRESSGVCSEALAREVLSSIVDKTDREVVAPLREELDFVGSWIRVLNRDHERAKQMHAAMAEAISAVDRKAKLLDQTGRALHAVGCAETENVVRLEDTTKHLSYVAGNLAEVIDRATAQAVDKHLAKNVGKTLDKHDVSKVVARAVDKHVSRVISAQQTAMTTLVASQDSVRASAATAAHAAIDYDVLASKLARKMVARKQPGGTVKRAFVKIFG